jgi:hypothetical protein
MPTLLKIFAAAGAIALLPGCAAKVVVIDSRADVVRLGPDVRGTVYLYQGGQWVKTSKVTLPEGWYAGPPPE